MNAFEDIGNVVIQQFAYVGGLSGQFWSGLLALPHMLPMTGKQGRWQSANCQLGKP